MMKLDIGGFFPEIEHFEHKKIFIGIPDPWSVFSRITAYIEEFAKQMPDTPLPAGLAKMGEGEQFLYCEKPIVLSSDLSYRSLRIFIGAGTKIEPSSLIKSHTVLGKGCDIRQGAYLRGGVIAGEKCTLGHATEIKNSILMNHSEAGHFNYIGDCAIGSYVNLGAGTKLANLKFRTAEAKKNALFPVIEFIHERERVSTGVSKFGAIIGDYCELGCNSVTSPATLLYPDCKVYPNFTVVSGIYRKGSFLKPS
jgi:NDP-sugar pyrophosphorylase family protein